MEYSAIEIATLLGGEVVGNPTVTVNNISKIEEGKPQTLSFMANPKYEKYLYSTEASVVIVNKTFEPAEPIHTTLIKVDDAYQAFSKLLNAYNTKNGHHVVGIQQPSYVATDAVLGDQVYVGAFAFVGEGAKIGKNVKIHSGVYIGDHVTIGDNCILYPGAKVYQKCIIGDNAIIHSNTVIGSDGFGFSQLKDGSYEKIPQTGNVVVGNNVEIGSNCTIDSATLGSTIIGNGVKMDNQIQIAHNVEIGDHTAIAAQVGISGSTKIGKRCCIGGQVGITGHLTIADDITIGAGSGVAKSFTTPGIALLGAPAYEAGESKKMWMASRRLPDMVQRINQLEHELKTIKQQMGDS